MINFRGNLCAAGNIIGGTRQVRRSTLLRGAIVTFLVLILPMQIIAGGRSDAKTAGNTASSGGKTTIVVADAKTTHHLNLYVAKELGIFDKYNLDVQITEVDDNAAARDLAVSTFRRHETAACFGKSVSGRTAFNSYG